MGLWQSSEFKVGLLVLVVAGLVAYMSVQVSEDPSYLGRSHTAWFVIPNANGLVKNSSIKTAGIPVGVIKDIRLQDGFARVDISVKKDVELKVSAAVEIQSQGILGDKFVGIYPGNIQDDPLAEGGQIVNIKDKGSMDNVLQKVGDIADSLNGVAQVLKESVTSDGSDKHVLGRIVRNIERLTGDLAQVTGENKAQIRDIVEQVHNITGTIDNLINDEGPEGFKANWKRAVASLGRIDTSLKNVEEITGKVNRGEGTLGRLVKDESTVVELNTAIEGVSNLLDTANKTETGVDFHSEYLNAQGAMKSYIGLKIQPGLDRYYLLQVVDDPVGVVETVDTKTTGPGGTTEITDEKTYRNKVKFTLLFAKNFYDFTLRAGLMENTGGLGIDYHFFRRKLQFSVDAFEFGKTNLRAYLNYKFYHGLYLTAGYNDLLNKSSRYSSFVGAGLLLTNDDLKMFVSKLPF